mgnify:CR=1 FL=1
MNRRQLLAASALTLAVPLGGCASTGESAANSAFSLTRTGDIPVAKHTSEFARSYPGQEPATEVVVGESSRPAGVHGVEIYNDSEDSVSVSLTVDVGPDEESLVCEGEGTISPGDYIALAISRPAAYTTRLAVSGADGDFRKAFDVHRSAWNATSGDDEGLSPEHNVHIRRDEIEVRFVGERR